MKRLALLLATAGLGLAAIAQDNPQPAAEPAKQPTAKPAEQVAQPKPARPAGNPAPNVRQQILQRQKERLTTAAEDILKRYDKNGDGKLDQAERDAMLKEFADAQTIARLARDYSLIERIDLNHDLKLSDDELKAFEQRVSNRPPHNGIRKQRPAAGLPQPPAKPNAAPAAQPEAKPADK
ncbi:MAG: hypothetical protein ACI4WT_09445 [Oligosphaeraceae bacterium]